MEDTLTNLFKIYGFTITIENPIISPSVTTYNFNLATGTRLSAVNSVISDIARDAGLPSIRIVNNKGQLYLEVPNDRQLTVEFRDLIEETGFEQSKPYELLLGIDTFGSMAFADLRKLPHLLIGGSTGSGKSVGIHMLINSLLKKNSPETLQLMLIDPKKTELSMYNGLPHLISEVVTELDTTSLALKWAVEEMESRYKRMQEHDTRDMLKDMPVILIVIDEMADLMLSGDSDIETNLIRLVQKARACGIHIIAATQRPSREVVTGLIKANLPARLAYRTASLIDSQVILDSRGAETLLGKGDSLYYHIGGMRRVQAAFISDDYLMELIDSYKEKYKRVNTLLHFKRVEEQNFNVKKKKKVDKVLLALLAFLCYSVYKMVIAGLKFAFAPVRTKKRR